MAARRIRPTRPLAPHGLPGHLVGFVEALRASGISVGPSETVDAGRVMATLGLGDREVLREGIACAVLRRPDHRETYDTMFDLWFPAALGPRAVVLDDDVDGAGDPDALPPDDVEAMRQMLLDLLSDNEDLADMDERLVAMIARIVETYGKYSSSRGPSFSSYQALKAMALDELEGKLLAGLLAPYGDEPTPTQEQIAKALAAQKITQLRKMVDAGKPNAIIVSAAGMVSMALIVVLAIYSSSGKLVEGLVGSAVFGLAGIVAQVVMMRIATMVIGIDMHQLFEAEEFSYESLMVAASQFALGVVVAVAIL